MHTLLPWSVVWERAMARPDHPLLVDGRDGSSFTTAELDQLSRRVVAVLEAQGLRPGDRVLVATEAEVETVVLMMGAQRLGVTAVVLHPHSPPRRVAEIARAAQARLALVGAVDRADLGVPAWTIEAFAERLVAAEPADDLPSPGLDDEAVVLFSSGSTGPGKGVRLAQGALQAGIRRLDAGRPADPDGRVGIAARLHTVTGYRVAIVSALLTGSTTVLLPIVPSPSAMLLDVAAHGVTTLHVGPGFARAWSRMPFDRRPPRPASLTQIIVGGGGMTDAERSMLAEGLGVAVIGAYGATETAGAVATGITLPGGPTTAALVPLTAIRVVDDDGRPLPAGETGHVEVAGASAMLGYLGGAAWRGEWLAPGDRGRFDEEGRLYVLGRVSRLWANPAALKVQLEDLEDAIREELGVETVALGGETLGVLVEGVIPTEAWIRRARERLRERLPEYAVPTQWVGCAALPLLPSGKHDLTAAAALFAERA